MVDFEFWIGDGGLGDDVAVAGNWWQVTSGQILNFGWWMVGSGWNPEFLI